MGRKAKGNPTREGGFQQIIALPPKSKTDLQSGKKGYERGVYQKKTPNGTSNTWRRKRRAAARKSRRGGDWSERRAGRRTKDQSFCPIEAKEGKEIQQIELVGF